MFGYHRYYWGFDPTYLLLILGMLLSVAASAKLKSTFATYKRVQSRCGLTGAEVARRVLRSAGITDVEVVPIRGNLTDHYDPRTKKVCLSEDVYNKTSLAAAGVAAHECAMPYSIRSTTLFELSDALVPVANFGANLAWPLFFIGLIMSYRPLLMGGFFCFHWQCCFSW